MAKMPENRGTAGGMAVAIRGLIDGKEKDDAGIMSILKFKGNWNIAKGKLKQRFARLTDDDLQFTEGKEDELIGRIQKRTWQAKHEVMAGPPVDR